MQNAQCTRFVGMSRRSVPLRWPSGSLLADLVHHRACASCSASTLLSRRALRHRLPGHELAVEAVGVVRHQFVQPMGLGRDHDDARVVVLLDSRDDFRDRSWTDQGRVRARASGSGRHSRSARSAGGRCESSPAISIFAHSRQRLMPGRGFDDVHDVRAADAGRGLEEIPAAVLGAADELGVRHAADQAERRQHLAIESPRAASTPSALRARRCAW